MGNREAQAAFKTRMQERGFTQANEWIPASQREALKKFAKSLREGGNDTEAREVTSNQSAVPEAVAEYYRKSRAKDPKSALERAARAVIEAEINPQIIEAEVARRVVKERNELAALRQTLNGLIEEAQADKDRAHELRMTLPGLMTEEEYRTIRGCLHPDRVPEDRKQVFGKAFDIFSRLAKSVNRIPISLRRKQGWS